jgi:mono/diheme cytochrome c family protein
VRGLVEKELRSCHPERSEGSAVRQRSKLARAYLATILLTLLLSVSALAENAAEIYKTRCWACHGATGAGDTMLGRNLKLRPLGSDEVQKQSDDELAAIIAKGRNRMPAFEHKLTKDQIRDLVRHIRSVKK